MLLQMALFCSLLWLSSTPLDSILKSRDVTLPTEVHLVEAMVFPVVMYGCESWTKKKAVQFSPVPSLSHVQLFVTPWTTAHQVSLSIATSWSLPKLMSIESVMPSNNLISVVPFSHPQSFPASGSFQMSQLFSSGGQRIGVSVSTSVLPMNTQECSPLGWTGWISLQSKGLSRVFSNTTVQKYLFFSAQLSSQSNSHIHTWLLEKP